ncbi:MAG TPA: lipase maturation factor family protein [Polyangia bacterium]|nr:lipase maturation factor family protein [Polyangia bacterium]
MRHSPEIEILPTPPPDDVRRKTIGWVPRSGPWVARLFHRLLALIFLVAWASLGLQVRVLIGARGLLPLDDVFAAARGTPGSIAFRDFPTLFWLAHNDTVLLGGCFLGGLLAILALVGLRPRLCFALSTVLYFSYATACRLFLSFQWDNLLLECGFLATFLPADRPATAVHFLFRLVLFKLYFESGVAKWQSPLGDWKDGSAMTYYYETAPLPTALAWTAYHLPIWWHHVESRATLFMELVVPFGIFGPRKLRYFTAALLTGFQLLNIASANYGFFCYLTLALHVFLFDEPTWAGLTADAPPEAPGWRMPFAALGVAAFVFASLVDGLYAFTSAGPALQPLSWVVDVTQRTRLINTYHLFAAITRERIEPEFQTLDAGEDAANEAAWHAHDLHHKPGDPERKPDLVAPHQPRADFQLWFYGLTYQRRQPAYVTMLLERMCADPPAVQPLFRSPLPAHPAAARIVFWQYHFSDRAEARADTGNWWRRERKGATTPVVCPHATPPQ